MLAFVGYKVKRCKKPPFHNPHKQGVLERVPRETSRRKTPDVSRKISRRPEQTRKTSSVKRPNCSPFKFGTISRKRTKLRLPMYKACTTGILARPFGERRRTIPSAVMYTATTRLTALPTPILRKERTGTGLLQCNRHYL